MQKIKVIQLAHASHSYFANENDNLKKINLNDWYTKTSKQIKNFHPEIEVECWAPEKINSKEETVIWEGLKFRFFPVNFSPRYGLDFSIPMLKELKKEIAKSKKEGYKLIIQLHEYHCLHGLVIASLFGKENLIGQHHGGSWPIKHLQESKKKRFFLPFFLIGQLWENLALKKIKRFYVLSKDELDYIQKKIGSYARFQTMGIEEECYKRRNKREARNKLGIPSGKKLIIYVGRICRIKGNYYLMDAMKELPDVELKMIGYGKEREEVESYAKKNNLTNVEFLGGVFGEEKLLYFSAADVLVLPSLKEGAPVVIMEALARNLPVISTDVGGVKLMIENEKEGYVIPSRNSKEIVKAVKKIMTWKNKNVKRYAERYKWKKIIDETVKDYKKI